MTGDRGRSGAGADPVREAGDAGTDDPPGIASRTAGTGAVGTTSADRGGRLAVVLAVLTVQAGAFGLAQAAGAPTLYAIFAVGSAAVLAAGAGGRLRGAVAAALGTAALGGGWWVVARTGSLLAGTPLAGGPVGALGGSPGAWAFLLGPVALSGAVALSGERWHGVAAATLASVLVVLLGLPLALFLARQDPALVAAAAADPAVGRTLVLSVLAPLAAAALSVLGGVPLAYLLDRGFPGRALVESLVDLPLVVPHSVAGLLVLYGFGEGGAFPGLSVLNGLPGMVLAMTFVGAPYAVTAAREAFAGVDPAVRRAARAHGAGPLATFRDVTLPLSARGVLAGATLAWARAVSEFGAVAVVAYTVLGTQHAPVYVYGEYVTRGLPEAGAVAVLLLALSAGLFLAVRLLSPRGALG